MNVFEWYILYTHSNFEKRVYNSLQQRDIICFLPLRKVTRQWSDRKKTIELPLFPNYLFVYTTFHERFKILEISKAAKYVIFNGCLAKISDDELVAIKKMMTDPEVSLEKCLIGDSIKITEGPFNGLSGIVFERKGKTRFGIRVNAINQNISVELNSTSIEKIEPVIR
jgi:transcription antitermination factor NusG